MAKAKSAIAEYNYSGVLYKDALATLQRKFGQPHAVVGAHLNKLSNFPPLKMHNSENVIGFSSTISGLVAVFKSLSFNDDLKSVNLPNQAVSKLPPNLKEAWSMQTVRRQWHRPTLLDFNEWLKEKAEGHERLESTDCESTHNVLLHGAEKIFPAKDTKNSPASGNANTKHVSNSAAVGDIHSQESTKGLLPVASLAVFSDATITNALALCDSVRRTHGYPPIS